MEKQTDVDAGEGRVSQGRPKLWYYHYLGFLLGCYRCTMLLLQKPSGWAVVFSVYALWMEGMEGHWFFFLGWALLSDSVTDSDQAEVSNNAYLLERREND